MKKLLFLLLALPTAVWAAGASVPLDRAPVNPHNQESLQRGASVFVNYCLSCHAASYMRYNRMQDFGLSEALIKENLLFAADKPGDRPVRDHPFARRRLGLYLSARFLPRQRPAHGMEQQGIR